VFFTAFLLKYFVAVQWHLLPVSGRQDGDLDATRVTGFFVIDALTPGKLGALVMDGNPNAAVLAAAMTALIVYSPHMGAA